MLLGLLPVLSFVTCVLTIASLAKGWGWKQIITRAVILTALYGVLTLELLSLFNAISRSSLMLIWLFPVGIFIVIVWRRKDRWHNILWPDLNVPRSALDRLLLAVVLIIVVLTGITAFLAPPNTYDSLTYHMPRVARWAQQGSLRPFATGILRQLYMSPGAEMGILHLYVMGQSDRLANFVQWSAMVVGLVGIMKVASELGAKLRGQLMAAMFAATLPMGIAQASSTMTDYVTALWVLLAVSETLTLIKRNGPWFAAALAGIAVGLAFLTKQTSLPFIIPFAIWALISLPRRYAKRKLVKLVVIGFTFVLLINLGHLTRNWLVFGNPLGGGASVATFINEKMNIPLFISNVLRQMSLHVGTPWENVNEQLYGLLAKVHWKLGVELTDPSTSIHPHFQIWPYASGETRTPNSIQAALIIITGAIMLIKAKRFSRHEFFYALAALTGFLLMAGLFKFTILGSRYHMIFFVLAAPLVGMVLGRAFAAIPISAISALMVVGAVPLLFDLHPRPLWSYKTGKSMFAMRRLDQYFTLAPHLDEPYFEMTEIIEDAGCDQIGFMLSGDTAEYLLWVFLDSPESELTIDWIISRSDSSGRFRQDGFIACAVVCEGCSDLEDVYNDLPLRYDAYGYRLYLEE